MSREIKFRAWDRDRKQMVDFGTDDFYYMSSYNNAINISGCHNMGGDPDSNIENFELMQFTGLKDKDNLEIYEGDILESDHSIAVVRHSLDNDDFRHAKPGFYLEHVTLKDKSAPNLAWTQHKVIGNVYDNPELIKGAD